MSRQNPFALSSQKEFLARYVPHQSVDTMLQLLTQYPLQLKVSKPRKTKYGDYRFPLKPGQPHRISVNSNLNSYAFLITLLHEIAHLEAFKKNGRHIKPHGPEWQNCFREISAPYLSEHIFPEPVLHAFRKSLARGVASSCTDLELFKILKQYDVPSDDGTQTLEKLRIGTTFALQQKIMTKGPKSRVRFRCTEIHSRREYMVHPLAEVIPLKNE